MIKLVESGLFDHVIRFIKKIFKVLLFYTISVIVWPVLIVVCLRYYGTVKNQNTKYEKQIIFVLHLGYVVLSS